MHRLLVSAAHKSSGKTTVTLGLCAALAETGAASLKQMGAVMKAAQKLPSRR